MIPALYNGMSTQQRSVNTMHKVRWSIYKMLCYLAWLVCPEPERKIIGLTYDRAVEDLRAIEASK